LVELDGGLGVRFVVEQAQRDAMPEQPAPAVDVVHPELDRVHLTPGGLGVLPGHRDRAADHDLAVAPVGGPFGAGGEGQQEYCDGAQRRCLHVVSPMAVLDYFRRGSSASRRPSPNRLKPNTVTKMARPGKSESQGLAWMKAMLALRSQPQLGVGGWVPSPRKLSVASTMIDVAMPSVVVTMIGARQLGSTWRKRIEGSRTPSARHASTYSFSLIDNTLPRTRRA